MRHPTKQQAIRRRTRLRVIRLRMQRRIKLWTRRRQIMKLQQMKLNRIRPLIRLWIIKLTQRTKHLIRHRTTRPQTKRQTTRLSRIKRQMQPAPVMRLCLRIRPRMRLLMSLSRIIRLWIRLRIRLQMPQAMKLRLRMWLRIQHRMRHLWIILRMLLKMSLRIRLRMWLKMLQQIRLKMLHKIARRIKLWIRLRMQRLTWHRILLKIRQGTQQVIKH